MKRGRPSSRWRITWMVLSIVAWSVYGASFAVSVSLHSQALKFTLYPGELWVSWTTGSKYGCRATVWGFGGGTVRFERGGCVVLGPPLDRLRSPLWLPRVFPAPWEQSGGFHPGERVTMTPLWMPALLASAMWGWLHARSRRAKRDLAAGRCAACGYDRASLPNETPCPECGKVTAP